MYFDVILMKFVLQRWNDFRLYCHVLLVAHDNSYTSHIILNATSSGSRKLAQNILFFGATSLTS